MQKPYFKKIIGIITHKENQAKAQAIRDTWLPKKIPADHRVFFVYGDDGGVTPRIEGDRLILSAKDEWGNLPCKMHEFFSYCVAHFEFEGLYKIDDDEYVPFNRLINYPDHSIDYAGVMLDCEKVGKEDVRKKFNNYLNQRHSSNGGYPFLIPPFYMLGGYSYYFSQKMIRAIASFPIEHYEDCVHLTGCEDAMMGKAFAEHRKNNPHDAVRVENWGEGFWRRFWVYPVCEIDLTAKQIYACHAQRRWLKWKHLRKDIYRSARIFLSSIKQSVLRLFR